jgi:predicted site-specific integrase-resolvase
VLQSVPTSSESILLVHHVAKRLGLAPRTVRWFARTGRIPARRINRRAWGFRPADVIAVVDLEMKRKAIEQARPPDHTNTALALWRTDASILTWLEAL